MNKTKEAPDCAATQTEAGMAEVEAGTIHQGNHTTGAGTVSRLLLHGRENAISTADLLQLTGLSDIRTLRERIEQERRNGTPILTCCGKRGGYFLPAADTKTAIAELKAFIHLQTGKGLGCLRSMKPAKRLLAELQQKADGQERMEL